MGGVKEDLIGILERGEYLLAEIEKRKQHYKEYNELIDELVLNNFKETTLGERRFYLRDTFAEANNRWKAVSFSRWELCVEEAPQSDAKK